MNLFEIQKFERFCASRFDSKTEQQEQWYNPIHFDIC